MTPEQFAIVVGAIVTLMTAAAAAFVTIYKTLHAQNAQLDDIHVAVNGNLAKARTDLAASAQYIEELIVALRKQGIAVAPPPV